MREPEPTWKGVRQVSPCAGCVDTRGGPYHWAQQRQEHAGWDSSHARARRDRNRSVLPLTSVPQDLVFPEQSRRLQVV